MPNPSCKAISEPPELVTVLPFPPFVSLLPQLLPFSQMLSLFLLVAALGMEVYNDNCDRRLESAYCISFKTFMV